MFSEDSFFPSPSAFLSLAFRLAASASIFLTLPADAASCRSRAKRFEAARVRLLLRMYI
jgi:hypothetical protein